MSSRLNLSFFTAGALALAAVSFPVSIVAANELAAATTELSAQTKEDPKNKKQAPANVAPKQGGGGQHQQRSGPPPSAPRNIERHVEPRREAPRTMERRVEPRRNFEDRRNLGGQKNINTQNKLAPAATTPRVGGNSATSRRVFTPRGANSRVVSAARIRGVPMRGVGRTTISGRNYSVWRSGYRVRRGGGWRTFVALGTLGALAIGAYEYYPYAYIEAPEEYCDGLTEDGCQLVFDNVETMEGGSAGQCVAYCPQQ
jgi:hypothetical protein